MDIVMKTRVLPLSILSLVLLTSVPNLYAASCSPNWCKNAKTSAEKAVCHSSTLRAADVLMNLLYKQIFTLDNLFMGERDAIKDDQHAFLALRDDMAYSPDALQRIYIKRIAELQAIIKQHQGDI
jgi:uncharacterized protein